MKLGVITDGISRDLEVALQAMSEHGLTQAELQYVWDKEVGDHDAAQIDRIGALLKQYDMQVPCISRHCFGGLDVNNTKASDTSYQQHLDGLKRCYALAQKLGAPLVRTMCFRKDIIMFGTDGADQWNAAKGAWDKTVELFAPIVAVAAENQLPVVVETGNNSNVCSAQLASKLCRDVGSPWLKVLWDPANALYCGEAPTPDGMQALLDDAVLAHLHLKDVITEPVKSHLRCVALGNGDMADHLQQIAAGLKSSGYAGAVSFESVYRPAGADFVDGFKASVGKMQELFKSA